MAMTQDYKHVALFTATPAVLDLLFFMILIIPVTPHRLITTPEEQNEWDSIIVSSDPIKIKQKQRNVTKEKDHAIRFNHNTLTEDRERARSIRDCRLNDISCLYGSGAAEHTTEQPNDGSLADRFLQKFSGITNVKFNEDEKNETKKSYWSLVHSDTHKHPYDDKQGWVTLDPVPWSISKVSKWKPNYQPQHQGNYLTMDTQGDRPWAYPPSHQEQVHHGASYSHMVGTRPSAHWGIANNDIITDHRPSNFPQGNDQSYHHHRPEYQMQVPQRPEYHQQVLPRPEPQQFNYQNNYYSGQYRPHKYPTSKGHPTTYPSEGSGEWVLLSTTKGYSHPQRYRDVPSERNDQNETELIETASNRNLRYHQISKYHEENLEDIVPRHKYHEEDLEKFENRKSDEHVDDGLRILHSEGGGSILASAKGSRVGKEEWKFEDSPILSTEEGKGGEAMTYRRKVRLTVLPPINNTSVLSDDGMLEVDASTKHQTIDEAQKIEEERLKKLSQLATIHINSERPRNRHQYQMIPVTITNGRAAQPAGKNAPAVFAALGAGMIPATMAMLVPMTLGRKKRDTSPPRPRQQLRFN